MIQERALSVNGIPAGDFSAYFAVTNYGNLYLKKIYPSFLVKYLKDGLAIDKITIQFYMSGWNQVQEIIEVDAYIKLATGTTMDIHGRFGLTELRWVKKTGNTLVTYEIDDPFGKGGYHEGDWIHAA
jgi:hypothetical protein